MANVISKLGPIGSGKSDDDGKGQSSDQLAKWAKQCPALSSGSVFKGVFSKDAMPRAIRDGECCIVNIQNTHDDQGRPLPGTHWVSCGCHKGQSWYFDSFGLAIPTEIKRTLRQPVYHSGTEIQAPDSDLCGMFALGACECVQWSPDDPPSVSLPQFMAQFDRPNLKLNDQIIKKAILTGRGSQSCTGYISYT